MNKARPHKTQSLKPPKTARPQQGRTHAGPRKAAPPLVIRRELLPPLPAVASQPPCFSTHDPQTGEVREYQQIKPGIYEPRYTATDAQETRRQRYEIKQAIERALGAGSRQYKCQRMRIDRSKNIQIKKSTESGKAFFSGFQACGSAWLCAVCAPKITEGRKVEVRQGQDIALGMSGHKVMLLTGTAPHGLGDDVRVVLAALKKAWKYTSSGRAAAAMRDQIGLRGSIRVLETTYGKNGWHPHFHALLILETDMTPAQVEDAWWPLWRDGCTKAGLGAPSREHGIRIDDGSAAADYVTKWGLEHELTKGHLKRGKTSCSPWDLARVMTFGPDHESISQELRGILQDLGIDQARAQALWIVYAKAFKGQRQLYWSNGLRKYLGMDKEKTDQQLADADEANEAETVMELQNDERIAIIRGRAWADVLTLAESDPQLIPELLNELKMTYEENDDGT